MKTPYVKVCLIFSIALAVKVFLVLFLNPDHTLEVFEYEAIADNIMKGNGFLYFFFGVPYRAFVQPFYPSFAAAVYYVTNHSHIAMGIIQSVVSSLLCFIVYLTAILFTGRKEALIASLLAAFHPGLTVYSVLKLHPLVFDAFFYILALCLMLRFVRSPGAKNAFLAGLAAGAALLSRFTIFLFLFLAVVYVFFMLKSIPIPVRLKRLLIFCVTAALVYSPWVIRNYVVFHKVVFVQTCSGENLWVGNSGVSSGSALLASGVPAHNRMPVQMRQELNRLDELGQVKYYKSYFMNFIKTQPLLFIRLLFKKFYYFWWFSPQTGILYARQWFSVYKAYYAIMLFFCIIGIFYLLRDKANLPALFIAMILMLSVSLIHAVVNVDTRHRWTIEPLLLIFSSVGIVKSVRYLMGHFTDA